MMNKKYIIYKNIFIKISSAFLDSNKNNFHFCFSAAAVNHFFLFIIIIFIVISLCDKLVYYFYGCACLTNSSHTVVCKYHYHTPIVINSSYLYIYKKKSLLSLDLSRHVVNIGFTTISIL